MTESKDDEDTENADEGERRLPRNLRFSYDAGAIHRPERWTARHDAQILDKMAKASKSSLSASSSSVGLRRSRGRMASLKKQGSLFATAAEDIIDEKDSRHLYVVYRLEQWLSNRTAQYACLVIVGLFLILVGGLLWMIVQDSPLDPNDHPQGAFLEGIWVAWGFMSDAGSHFNVVTGSLSNVVLPKQRVVGSIITVLGIIFFAALIGVVVDVIRNKMDLLRQGRSRVVEKDHSLILGWTEKSILLIEELCIANQSMGGGTIVVMAKNGKQDMEGELHVQLPAKHHLGSKVVFRSGSPLLTHDLIKVGAHKARSIIILAGDNEPNQADAETLRCILVLRTLPYGLRGFIVAEVRDISNEPLLKMVGGSNCETVPSHDILGRLMLMAGRSPGLAKVYESLLGFEGDEFYMWEWPELAGLPFENCIGRFPDAIPIGLCAPNGTITLNPPPEYVIHKGDKLIVIAEDDDTYKPEPPVDIDVGTAPPYSESSARPEFIFVAGWRRDVADIITHLDNLVQAGSELHMMTHCVSSGSRNEKLEDEGLDVHSLKNLEIIHHDGNTTVRRKLEALELEACTSCMIFADQAFEIDTMHADSHSLATLLLIRDTQMTRFEDQEIGTSEDLAQRCPIICEILDPRTQKTIAGSIDVQHSSEFCHSNLMIAQIMAMVSENRTVKALLDEMLGHKGCSVTVFPASRFANSCERVSFWCLAKRAIQKRTLLLGFTIKGSIDPPNINPEDKNAPRLWDGCDLVALVASSTKGRPKKGKTTSGVATSVSNATSDIRGRNISRGSTNNGAREPPQTDRRRVAAPQEVSMRSQTEGSELGSKILHFVETLAALDDGERSRLCKVLDGIRDVVGSLPVSQVLDGVRDVAGSLPAHRDLTAQRRKVLRHQLQQQTLAEAAMQSFSTRFLCLNQEPI